MNARRPQHTPTPRGGLSLRLGRVLGIDIIVHWTFPLLLVWIAFDTWRTGGGWTQGAERTLFVLAIFVCVVMHEYGHALTARRFGIRTRDITLLPIGGVARLERMPERPSQEILVALAGPAVNVAIAGLLLAVLIPLAPAPASADDLLGGPVGFFWTLAIANIFLVLFNMIPAFPMDGGRVLRALLALRLSRADATQAAANVGLVFAGLFAIGGIFYNPFLLLIALFVFSGGQAEARMARIADLFSNLAAEDAMMSSFDVLDASDTLARAEDALLAGSQTHFPVVRDGQMIGMVTREALVRAAEYHPPDALVESAVLPLGPALRRHTPLAEAVRALAHSGTTAAPVLDGVRVVGLFTLDNAEELAALRRARRRR